MKRFATRSLVLAASSLAAATVLLAACAGSMSGPAGSSASNTGMSFFVSSTGSGKGADLGGLAGADRLCTSLATAAGAGNRTWRAYLSTQPAAGSERPVNARDRIGTGPWRNAKGVVIASNLTELHGTNNINKQTALTEKGEVVNGRGDTPNMHDILTGSQPDGTAIAGNVDTTCGNWTKGGEGAAMLGHSDRMGLGESVPDKSWNSSHLSRGCSLDALKATGGDARIYCFAAN
jgi:hypothetical protein